MKAKAASSSLIGSSKVDKIDSQKNKTNKVNKSKKKGKQPVKTVKISTAGVRNCDLEEERLDAIDHLLPHEILDGNLSDDDAVSHDGM